MQLLLLGVIYGCVRHAVGDVDIYQGQGPSNARILDFRHDFQFGI